MFVGHALLAFALAALVADWRGWSARRALLLGAVAGGFAAIPDLDVAYSLVSMDAARVFGGGAVRPGAFWDAGRDVHRSMTHSLVVALLAGPAFGLWTVRAAAAGPRRALLCRAVGASILLALVGVAVSVSGLVGAVVMTPFVLAGVGIAAACRKATDLSAGTVGLAATAGLFSHPWGDLLTGAPPRLLYPFDARVFDARVVLHGDPTIHLLAAFALELAVVWLAVVAVTRVTGRSWTGLVDRRAAVGVGYGVAAVVMSPPTLEVSYHFVFSILAVGLLCGGLVTRPRPARGVRGVLAEFPSTTPAWLGFVGTTLATVTAALGGYAAVYATVVAAA